MEELPTVQLESQKALRITEIQDRILSFADIKDCARFARTSQAMKEVALDHVWHTVDGIAPLLRILFNVDKSQPLSSLSGRLKRNHWDRFSTFALRIKVLHFAKDGEDDTGNSTAWREVLRSRPEIRILPNLKRLYIDTSPYLLQYTVLFLHESLETLSFDVGGQDLFGADLEVFFDEIAIRAPRLKHIYAYLAGYDSTTIQEALSRCLASQALLTNIYLMNGTLTAMVMKSLSTLPKLKAITLPNPFTMDPMLFINFLAIENIDFLPARGGVFFPSLQHLDIETRLESATSLFSSHSSFVALRELKIDMISHNGSQDVQRCLRVISKMCPILEHLTFCRNLDDGNRLDVLEEEAGVLTKDTLAPLVSLIHLQRFYLAHTQPIVISDDELVELLSRCPPLEELHLNPSPIRTAPPMSHLPSLAVLHRIAQCQPKLKRLSLFLETSYEDELYTTPSVTTLANPFDNLETLTLGKSAVSDVDRVALYLSQVLPLGCVITHDAAMTTWSEVINKLPLFMIFSTGQRQRVRELEGMLELAHSKYRRLSSSGTTLQGSSSDAVGPE